MPRFLFQTILCCTIFIGAGSLFAQNEPIPAQTEAAQGQKIRDRSTSYWRFGLSITNAGQAQGIIATSPIPIECPEQTVELIQEEFGDGVKGVKVKPLKPLARQMVFKIASLGPDQGGNHQAAHFASR